MTEPEAEDTPLEPVAEPGPSGADRGPQDDYEDDDDVPA